MCRRYPYFLRKYFYGHRSLRLWPFLIFFSLLYSIGFDPSSSDDYDSLNELSFQILLYLSIAAGCCAVVYMILYFVDMIGSGGDNTDELENREFNFKDSPESYDRMTVQLTGKVEHVLRNNDDNLAGRPSHERFILSSPQLRPNQRLLIINNLSFNGIRVRVGDWLEVRGEYLHEVTDFYGRDRYFYGKLHFIHHPRGFIRKVKYNWHKMQNLEEESVIVTEPEDASLKNAV